MLKFLVLAVVVVAAIAEPCCTPKQWMSRYGSVTGSVTQGMSNTMKVEGAIAYDFTNMKSAVSMEYTVGSMKVQNKTIIDYQKKLMYMINMNQDCSVSMVEGDMKEACVPDNAMDMGEYYFGVSTMLNAKGFGFEMEVAGGKIDGIVSVTKEECAPITEVVYGTVVETKMMTTVGFFDIMALDPSMFDIPAGCDDKKATKGTMKLSASLFGIPHVK